MSLEQIEARWMRQLETEGHELVPAPARAATRAREPEVTRRRPVVHYVSVSATTPATARVSHRRTYALALGITTGLGIVAGGLWLAATVVAWIAAHLAAILGGLAVVVVLLVALAGSGKCPGLHCPGCGS